MTIDEFLADKDRTLDYQKWIKSETGIMVCSVLSEHFLRPILPGAIGQAINETSAAFCLGENSGSWKLYDALRDLAQQKQAAPSSIDESYNDPNDPDNEREIEGE